MHVIEGFHKKVVSNNSRLAINKYGQNLTFPNDEECATRRDYILHRLGAISQQMYILRQMIDSYTSKHGENTGDTGAQLELTFNAINQLSYCFDNLVFNLSSLSDYFGNYLGLYIYGSRCQTLKWSGLVNKLRCENKDHDFSELVIKEHQEWFTRLHEYRGDIIHKKAILIEVEGFENRRVFPSNVEKLNFEINNVLKKYFHIFRKGENQDLSHCAEKICHRTLIGLSRILDASEEITCDAFKQFKE